MGDLLPQQVREDMAAVVEALRHPPVLTSLLRLAQTDEHPDLVHGFDPEEEITGRSREDITVVYHEPGDEDIALLLGQAYQSLKQISKMAVVGRGYVHGGGDAERAFNDIMREAESRMMTISTSRHTSSIQRGEQHG